MRICLGQRKGEREKEREWIAKKVKDWVTALEAVVEVSRFVL